jgi:hypothetical protein
MSAGIAGQVATNATALTIDEAYDDERFNQAIDKKTGYRTKSILCMPIFGFAEGDSKEPEIIGVFQAINKMDDTEVFNHEDESILEILLRIAGPVLQKSKFFDPKQKKAVDKQESAVGMGMGRPKKSTFKPSLGGLSSFAE